LCLGKSRTYSVGGADDATTGAVIEEEESLLEESPLRRIVFILDMYLLNLFFSPPVAGASVAGVVSGPAMSFDER